MKINLFYLSSNTTGGWVTFTHHLIASLKHMGHDPVLYKIGNNTEAFTRPFGYGDKYHNVSPIKAAEVVGEAPTIIVAVAKNYAEHARALLKLGAHIVIHDPTELASYMRPEDVAQTRPWVIRKANAARLPGSVFIRHPYVRQSAPVVALHKRRDVISVSRIDFDKNTDIILEANEHGADITIHGFENRLYTKFKIQPRFPNWQQSVRAYPRDADAAFRLLAQARAMVDMSLIKGDGGGTQYTFLEAWDAGTVPIINAGWYLPKDDMRPQENCLIAGDGGGLATICLHVRKPRNISELEEIVAAGQRRLTKHHAPKVIVPQVIAWLEGKA